MANYQAGRVRKRRNHSKRDAVVTREQFIIGFDSEADTTSDGRPMLFQFSLPNTSEDDTILRVVPPLKHAGFGTMLNFLDEFCTDPNLEYLIYAWNTSYELTQLFHDLPREVLQTSEFSIPPFGPYEWTTKIINFKRQIAEFHKGRIFVKLLDGTGFYKISLDAAARMLGLGEKYEMASLSRATFTRADLNNEDFLRYARRDAYITRLIGEYIQDQHKQYNVPTTISAPHFAATVFKTQFLTKTISIPSAGIEQAGLSSYHGGKNGFYLNGPTEYASIYQYDITSAYPEAMKQLPNIETAIWKPVTTYRPGIHALYQVTMDYTACQWRGMQNHDGSWPNSGLIQDTWLTGYELDEIINRGEGTILSLRGYQYLGDSGGPLYEYVRKFFTIKRHSSGPERETAKLLLNSLYGKFFQKQPVGSVGTYDFDVQRWVQTDPKQDYDYEAGGLYHPPIASLITGFVRAKIHRLEHKYESIMTSTDGLFGAIPPDAEDIGNELGQLTVSRGRLRIWRERLYIFDGEDGKRKYALHGFHSNVNDLEQIPLARGEYMYEGRQMITLKMSTRKSRDVAYSPGQFVTLPFVLRI